MELADVVRTAVVEDLKKNSREFLDVSIIIFVLQNNLVSVRDDLIQAMH